MADAGDLNSPVLIVRAGSSPALGTQLKEITMGTIKVIVECDEEGCEKTADQLKPRETVGWSKCYIPVGRTTDVVQDYCPDHTPTEMKWAETL